MKDFQRNILLGSIHNSTKVYCEINYTNNKLFISGITENSYGQIQNIIKHAINNDTFVFNLDKDTVIQILDVWDEWQLNSHCDKECDDEALCYEAIMPQEILGNVLKFLHSLPNVLEESTLSPLM